MSRSTYLFDPDGVRKLLNELPDLCRGLGDPVQEGESSISFPAARKSERQIYRVLSNVHCPHLAALARSLNFCIARGFSQPTILRTRDRSAFQSALSELHIAEHLLLRGFEIEGLDLQKGSDPVPEFITRRSGLTIAVEVYAPREWEGLTGLMDNLLDAVKNLDLPFDYSFAVRVEQLQKFDAHHRLLFVHPGELARALDSSRGGGVLEPLIAEVKKRLEAGETALHVAHNERELNLRIMVDVEEVAKSGQRLPTRWGVISPPNLSGYAPEAMFDRLTHRRVRAKASKGQASGLAPISLLVVDLAHAELSSELVHDAYRAKFEQVVRKRLGSGLPDYDAIALCQWHSWGEQTQLRFWIQQDGLAAAVREGVFGS
jgi:hypothetical protein